MCRRAGTEWRCTTGPVPLHMLLCAGLLALLLTGAAQGAASPGNPSQAVRESAALALSASPAETGGSAMAVQTLPYSDTAAQPPDGRKKDLTVFFSVGVIADLLLVAAFVAWAIRQWRNSR